jgi:hypothetical protein
MEAGEAWLALAQRIEALRHELPEVPGRRRLTHASGRDLGLRSWRERREKTGAGPPVSCTGRGPSTRAAAALLKEAGRCAAATRKHGVGKRGGAQEAKEGGMWRRS